MSKKFSIKISIGFGIGKKIGIEKVSDSVSEIFGIGKRIEFGIGKYLISKKVSDWVSEIFGIGKKFWIQFCSDFWYRHTLLLATRSSNEFSE